MGHISRRNSALADKIARLKLQLAPLFPLPAGPPHPSFPKTIMAFHLLTEDELDSIAHYYHQSTPGPYTNEYPASMNWDKEFLAKRMTAYSPGLAATAHLTQEDAWLADLVRDVARQCSQAVAATTPAAAAVGASATLAENWNPYINLTDQDRIRIKRRKVGKFIGLSSMETPVEEVLGRIHASLERAITRSREELKSNEDAMMGRRKLA